MLNKFIEWFYDNMPSSLVFVSQNVVIMFLFILLLLVLTGCKTKEVITHNDLYTHDTLYVERCKVDTIVKVEADTALTRLLVECDEHNNALVAILENNQGERVVTVPLVKYVTIKDTSTNELRRQAYIDISALALEQQQQISILEEKVAQGNTVNKQLTEELKKTPKTAGFWAWAFTFLLGFAFGAWICFKLK